MPILAAEPDLFPADLLDLEQVPPGAEWAVLHTLPRREKDLMRRLRAAEIGYYGPVVKRRYTSPSGRKRVSFVPLFASYVFALATAEQKQQIFATNCICQCLPVADPARLVADLRQIRQLISTEAPLTPEARLQPGNRVRIRSGAMQGFEGTIVTRRGQDRLIVSVEMLQVGASVQLDDCELEKIDV